MHRVIIVCCIACYPTELQEGKRSPVRLILYCEQWIQYNWQNCPISTLPMGKNTQYDILLTGCQTQSTNGGSSTALHPAMHFRRTRLTLSDGSFGDGLVNIALQSLKTS